MTPYIGEIRMWPGTFAPLDWAFCDGRLLPVSQYEALYTLIGTTYGGDGVNTFALPDMRGCVPVHYGTGPGLNPVVEGQRGGNESAAINQSQMPVHNHLIGAQTAEGAVNTPANNTFANAGTGDNDYALGTVAPNALMGTMSVLSAGGSQPFEVSQPSLCLNFILSLYGVWPSQN